MNNDITVLTIFGKPFIEYMNEQFPATVGHIPLKKYFDKVQEMQEELERANNQIDQLLDDRNYL